MLFEYEPANREPPLFKTDGIPRQLAPADFDPTDVAPRDRQARPATRRSSTRPGARFCLYVVLGNGSGRAPLVELVNAVLATVQIAPRTVGLGLSAMGAWAGPFVVAALLLTVAGALKAYDPINDRRRAAPGAACRFRR